mmetsp:Transcript_4721/g.12160  ORF Transcript_4721/g.12160 Transcript_4721/m.12160 type:complete len:297 (-) Transcript_4721:915-1805(-)
MIAKSLWLCLAAASALTPGRVQQLRSTSARASVSAEEEFKVIERVIGAAAVPEVVATESASVAPWAGWALGAVPNLGLAAALALGWDDDMVRILCGAAIAARIGAGVAAEICGDVPQDVWWSGLVAVARAKSLRPAVPPPLRLGEFVVDDDNALVSSLEVATTADGAAHVARLLERYYAQATDVQHLLITQPSPTVFTVLAKFASRDDVDVAVALRDHQTSEAFLTLVEQARPFLAAPIAIYLVNQKEGQLGNARHPFGPGGEGGRDDAIYSSPSNLDGSQVGSKIGIEASRSVDL